MIFVKILLTLILILITYLSHNIAHVMTVKLINID